MNNHDMNAKSEQTGWIAWFASNPIAANLLMVLIILGGLLTAQSIKVEDFPERPANAINVNVTFASGVAATTEQSVTIKLEQALQGVNGVEQLTSLSTGDYSQVTVKSKDGYDLDVLLGDIKQQVDGIGNLPKEAETPVLSKRVNSEDAYLIQVHGDLPLEQIQHTAEQLRKTLLADANINQVNLVGARYPEVLVEAQSAKLAAFGLSISDLVDSINGSSTITPGGVLYSQQGSIAIKADQLKTVSRDFANIIVRQDVAGQTLRLSDVATIKDTFTESGDIAHYNGLPSIGVFIQQTSGTNVLEMAKAADKIVAGFAQSLPAGIEVTTWYDSSEYIVSRLSLLANNSLMGIAIVMFLLALFLNVRIAFWVAVGLPVAFSGALLLMGPNFYGLSLNELTTFGFMVVLGIVVDDAVVIGESIYAERERSGPSLSATIRGAQRVALPTTFGVLTSVVAFMSLVLVEGTLGKIFAFFAYTAAFCLLFSLIESKLILPAHLAHLRMHSSNSRNPIAVVWRGMQGVAQGALNYWTKRIYKPFINVALGYRYAVFMLAIAVFIGIMGMVASGHIRSVFFPEISINYVQANLEMQADAGDGLSQEQAIKLEQLGLQLNQELQQQYNLEVAPIPNIVTYTYASGAVIMATLSDMQDRPITGSEIAKLWQAKVQPMEGVSKVQVLSSDDSDADISLELRSGNAAELEAAAKALANNLQAYPGVSGLRNSLQANQVQLDVQLNALGESLGLSASGLAIQLQHAYQGLTAQRLQRGDYEVPVKVIYPSDQRRRITDLQQAMVRTGAGHRVPLASVATIKPIYSIDAIERINQQRVAVVTANVDKSSADVNAILAALQAQTFNQIKLDYPSVDIILTGEAQEKAKSTKSLYIVFAIAMLGIYGLLAIPLKSYAQPLIVMMAIPFGLIGALIGHWIHAMPVSLLSMLGIVALAGVVVNDSLLLINSYNQHRQQGESVHTAMVNAAAGRMRAIVLTSITTFAGLMPLIGETAESAQILIPAAVAMAYGILFATFITLLLIPALVMILEDIRGLFKPNNKLTRSTAGKASEAV